MTSEKLYVVQQTDVDGDIEYLVIKAVNTTIYKLGCCLSEESIKEVINTLKIDVIITGNYS